MDFLPNVPPLPPPFDFDQHYQLDVKPEFYGNDVYDDCVIATRAHHTIRLVWAKSRSLVHISPADVIIQYEQEIGTPFHDSGLDLMTSLDQWQTSGWFYGEDPTRPRLCHKIESHSKGYGIEGGQYPGQDPSLPLLSPRLLQMGICSNFGAHANLILPPNVKPTNKDSFGSNHLWDDTTDSLGDQHVVLLTGYGAESPAVFLGIGWGARQSITWAFLQKRCFSVFFVESGEST